MYGPPGTGKTQLCNVIINKAGLFGLVHPLSSSELNRSKVGESEQLIMAIFHRALYVKHLLCCIAIDEVDALTPKRNEKSGEHKVDVLCLLLSLIGGIKDVPNVFVIASTNRLNKIDDAFARRLEDKFYVGRLNSDQRLNLIQKVFNEKENKNDIPPNARMLDFKKRADLFTILTTNFSGAALCSLRSKILFFIDSKRHEINPQYISDEILIKICTQVAKDFQIKLGGYLIPQLLNESNISRFNTELKQKFSYEEYNKMSGRILIDLRENFKSIQIELVNGNIKEIELDSEKKFTGDIIPLLLSISIIFKVPFVQLIDSNLLLSNAAYDENTALEVILERYSEFEQYPNSLFIFDVDTVVGISESMSDMSDSSSYSIQNARIWQQVILHTFKSPFAKKTDRLTDHKWCIIISSSEFLINQLKRITKFDYSIKEKEYRLKERICARCGLNYTNKDNKKDACSFHKNKTLESFSKDNKIRSTFSKEALLEKAKQDCSPEIFNSYYYLCCMKKFNESSGCEVDWHV